MVKLDLPYISGFLAFRECPHLVELVSELRSNRPDLVPQILLVDGMGVLHPRGLGLASHLGVLTDLPTIGVGKTFLNVDGLRKDAVLQEIRKHLLKSGSAWELQGESGRILGAAFRSTEDAPNPVFISRGHRITLGTALEVVRRCCKYRVPEPIRLADKGSREYLRVNHRPTSAPVPTRVHEPHSATAMHLHDDRWIVALQRMAKGKEESGEVAIHFCLDNSGSMGISSRACLDCFSELVTLATEPCSLTVFSDTAETLSTSLRTPAEVSEMRLPSQGMTNITDGVQCMLKAVQAAAQAKPQVHHILILLTDGDHNHGDTPGSALPRLASKFHAQLPHAKVSFLVIGVTAQSRTDLGMLAKTTLETVPLPNLRSIYFCVQAREMQDTLGELRAGLRSMMGGKVVRVCCPAAQFHASLSSAPASDCDLFVTAALSKPGAACFAQMPCTTFDGFQVDGVSTTVKVVEFDEEVAMQAVEALLHLLRQKKVASGDVRAELAMLEPWMRALEIKLGGEQSGVDLAHLTPLQRVQLHKRLTGGLHKVRQLRNEVAMIAAMAANTSAAQAEFLTGATGKYAAKALTRSDPAAHTVDAILQDLQDRLPKLRRALLKDTRLLLGRVQDIPALEAAAGDRASLLRQVLEADLSTMDETLGPELVAFVQRDLPPLLRRVLPLPESYLSLQTNLEHLAQWASTSAEEIRNFVGSEYELLMCFGIMGLPVTVHRSNAGQVDPFQCRVSDLLPSACDTASLFVALKSGLDIKSPEGPPVEDVLVTIDPNCPHASAVVYWSRLVDTLYSVVLCRDLFMYSGPTQRIALHAHAFCSAVGQAQHEVFTARALQILYSVRRHWGVQGGQASRALAARLLRWESITEADGVSHPVEILLALAALDWGDLPALQPPALMILFNEILSRRARTMLRGMTSDHTDASTLKLACTLMRRALGIADDSCPQPTPPEEKEPPLDVTRDTCRCDYTMSPTEFDIPAFLEETLRPTITTLHFIQALHTYLEGHGGWSQLMTALEEDTAAEAISFLAVACRAEAPPSALHLLGEEEPRRQEAIGVAMVLQAFLHHVSANRQQLGDTNDGTTLRELVKDLRMDVYMGRLHSKNAARQAIIGCLVYEKAIEADEDDFGLLVGAHAHGLPRQEFWALARAAKCLSGRKREIFLDKCNTPFPSGERFRKL
eukprot:GGOE01001912.1.p1 GENE.GGOE01001912.1~~GGOE01001912.1.p1  ORF type:complete len:1281 (-),score=336.11 GGOE01001912.1:239-3772(-)